MAPNKEWMSSLKDRFSEKYKTGVEEFLDYALKETGGENTIRCPCVKCKNTDYGSRHVVHMHLYAYGIMPNYTTWYHHGERFGDSLSDDEESEGNDFDEVREILRDLCPSINCLDRSELEIGSTSQNKSREEPNIEAKTFYRLLEESEESIYPGCETSRLSVLVNLLHIKSTGRWSNESFNMLLKLLKQILPSGSTLPESYYDAKKIIKDLGLSYHKIDDCINDCMLYWKEEEECQMCKVCGASRWKEDSQSGEIRVRGGGKKLAMKTLRYFPLKPRLQRLFMSKKTASLMRWHSEKRVDDGLMRHPADSMAWKSFDEKFEDFSAEPRNVRLGLASDGFQPFTHSKTSYSIWPVILIPYNFPPWMCMKQPNFILSMLIPGPEGPGDAIDVYLQPLIEELKELWEVGVETYDASTHQNFKLHASLLWTINDFPAYGNLSGWSTKGKMACPCCNKDTCSMRLVNGKKQCYMGHRRYLPSNHKWRKNRSSFDGSKEVRAQPRSLSGDDVLAQVDDLNDLILTKAVKKKVKVSHEKRGDNWNKKRTIMNVKGKTEDNLQARLDLEAMKIRPELHPIRRANKLELPVASYTLSPEEKNLFCLFLKHLRVPDGFSSNISQSVNMKERKISGLKSHDCHVLLLDLLPLGIRGLLPKSVCEPLIELSLFFRSLGAKTLNPEDLENLESQIPITLCKLEQIFPPSFFDVMVHLPVHLANEAKIAGSAKFRWMYPIERMLYDLKQLIRNMARPEGSIAEGYIAKECMTLCSRYLRSTKTKFNTLERNFDGGFRNCDGEISIFSQFGRALGAGVTRDLDDDEWVKAHIYVLKNCDKVQPFIEEYSQNQQNSTQKMSDDEWNTSFIDWFKKKVEKMQMEDQCTSSELLSLARGPFRHVTCFSGYVVNGYRFRIEARDNGCKTQNSGVCVVGDIGSGADYIDYYGVLTEILEMQYLDGKRVLLFRCRWFNVYDEKGAKTDEYGFTSVNFQRLLKTNEPFILASQASQVFYAIDNANKGWHVVIKTQPRDSYEMPLGEEESRNDDDFGAAYQHEESFNFECGNLSSLELDGQNMWRRTDLEPTAVDTPSINKKRKRRTHLISTGDIGNTP